MQILKNPRLLWWVKGRWAACQGDWWWNLGWSLIYFPQLWRLLWLIAKAVAPYVAWGKTRPVPSLRREACCILLGFWCPTAWKLGKITENLNLTLAESGSGWSLCTLCRSSARIRLVRICGKKESHTSGCWALLKAGGLLLPWVWILWGNRCKEGGKAGNNPIHFLG